MSIDIKGVAGQKACDQIHALLACAYPHEAHEAGLMHRGIDAGDVRAVIVELWKHKELWDIDGDDSVLNALHASFRELEFKRPSDDDLTYELKEMSAGGGGTREALTTYMASATHSRWAMPGERVPTDVNRTPVSRFTGELPMVRVQLPDKSTQHAVIQTSLGDVDWDKDHQLRSVESVNDFYKKQDGRENPEGKYAKLADSRRVDLVTPTRVKGRRFAATAFYLCYRNAEDKVPSHFVLEGGHAGGAPAVCYPSLSMGERLDFAAGYVPTALTSADHWYAGTLKMKENEPDEPDELHIQVSVSKGGPTMLETKIKLVNQGIVVPRYNPSAIYAEAALRMVAIAGEKAKDFDELRQLTPFQLKLAQWAGKTFYTWGKKPA
jgi:hypothetical protein